MAASDPIYYNRLVGYHILEDIVHLQLFEHYDQLIQHYPTLEQFVQHYQVDDATWQSILTLADKKKIPRHQGSIKKYGDEIRDRYKAILANSL